jgi:hypothetical protein
VRLRSPQQSFDHLQIFPFKLRRALDDVLE